MSSSNQQNLRELLRGVQQRLHGAEQMDLETRESLVALMREIELKLRSTQSDATGADPPMPRLEALAVKFEASHPALAQTLLELADALGKAGI